MPSAQRNRQRAVQRAKMERARAAQQKAAARRKRLVAAGAIVAVLALVGVLLFVVVGGGNDDTTDVATSDPTSDLTTPTSQASADSAAGKPCVKTAEPTPPGAPEVPVKEGSPPKKLIMEDISEGTGAVVPAGSTITVDYIGVACSTGKIFDFSYGKQPATFALSGVIPGWTQGIPGMKVGGTRLLGIPSALAYGARGSPPDIGPDEPLWFVVEVRDTKPTEG